MRCLLGLHMSRAATANMEAAFKALRKWAELQRRERARLALERMRAAAGESVDGATPTGASDGGASSQTPRASELSGAGDGEALAAPGSAGGRSFELFVSMADYPIPAGATWRSPLEKQVRGGAGNAGEAEVELWAVACWVVMWPGQLCERGEARFQVSRPCP